MEILDYHTRLAERMITSDPDVTIGDYWKLIREEDNPVMVVSSETVAHLPKRYYSQRMKPETETKEPMVRPTAKYDNRSHEEILDQYAPVK